MTTPIQNFIVQEETPELYCSIFDLYGKWGSYLKKVYCLFTTLELYIYREVYQIEEVETVIKRDEIVLSTINRRR